MQILTDPDGRERAHWVFEADAPPEVHPAIRFEAAPDELREGAVRERGGAWSAPRPSDATAGPSTRTVRIDPVDLAARAARVVPALTTDSLGVYGNVWIRAHRFAAVGEVMPGHAHRFDHVSFLTRGRVRVEVAEHATDYTAPMWIIVRRGLVHRLICLEAPAEWWCVFAIRDADGEPVELFDPAVHDPLWSST